MIYGVRLRRMRSWWSTLALLVAARLAIPIAAYVDAGSKLPGVPRFVRPHADGGLQGDATGFYAAAREFMAAWGRMPRALFALDVLSAIALALMWRRRPDLRPWLVPVGLFAAGLAISLDIHWMKTTGAAVFGWPLVWSLPMFAYRALGFGLSKHAAWDIG